MPKISVASKAAAPKGSALGPAHAASRKVDSIASITEPSFQPITVAGRVQRMSGIVGSFPVLTVTISDGSGEVEIKANGAAEFRAVKVDQCIRVENVRIHKAWQGDGVELHFESRVSGVSQEASPRKIRRVMTAGPWLGGGDVSGGGLSGGMAVYV